MFLVCMLYGLFYDVCTPQCGCATGIITNVHTYLLIYMFYPKVNTKLPALYNSTISVFCGKNHAAITCRLSAISQFCYHFLRNLFKCDFHQVYKIQITIRLAIVLACMLSML